jgi:hypothetical protein
MSSIFIPSVHRSVDIVQMQILLSFVGEVERIDFVEMKPQKANWRRAFVHFRSGLMDPRELDEAVAPGNQHSYYVVGNAAFYFMTMLLNRSPVPTTSLNLHQIAHQIKTNDDQANKRINQLEEEIRLLREMHHVHEFHIKGIWADLERDQVIAPVPNETLSQEDTQEMTMTYSESDTEMEPPHIVSEDDDDDDDDDSFSETTSSSSSATTYSSLPDLIVLSEDDADDLASDSTHSSMPELIPLWPEQENDVDDLDSMVWSTLCGQGTL